METENTLAVERQEMEIDIACVGFGPAMAGFLKTLTSGLMDAEGNPIAESQSMPGMPPQVICYERSDDIGFGVSGVVTRGRGLRQSFPDLDPSTIPTAAAVKKEEVVYLFDPIGASRKTKTLKAFESLIRPFKSKTHSFTLPWIPPFLNKHPGYVFSLGQFCSWVGQDIMGSGLAQIWPGTPVSEVLMEERSVKGIRLINQGVDKHGNPQSDFMPGMDIRAALTVIGDGPTGALSRQLDAKLGLPEGHVQRDWAIGMKAVVKLPESCTLEPGTVIHTMGFPEPEIFGYMYVFPDGMASLGVFVPSWFDHPGRTAYRYFQHWMMHPYLWQHLEGGTLQSWGAKSLGEWGRRGEPHLVGEGFARIGECSGSTNVLTNSGVDEAWTTGVQLGESVLELLKNKEPFTQENLEKTYLKRRRESWLEKESLAAENARDGFQLGFIRGMIGTALAGLTNGKLHWPAEPKLPQERIPSWEAFYADKLKPEEIQQLRSVCEAKGQALHDDFMDRVGWPQIPLDGQLLLSQQDALLIGGKVTAGPGYADHVTFIDPLICMDCKERICIEACSGQAIQGNPENGVPIFEREKCVHCGACVWNCSKSSPSNPERSNICFVAGSGGLHSAEN
jgi:electron-transferring-flavoprotein dehydrogenase